MTTENNNSETDNEVPQIARVFGRTASEWVTYLLIVFCMVAVVFGSIVGGERDVQAERAMATLGALTEVAENKASEGSALVCDETLLDPELLANDYLTISVGKAPINEDNKSLGYGPALYIGIVEKEVSGDTWDTAKRLMDLVKEAGEKEAELNEDRSRGVTADASLPEVGVAEGDIKEPKNRLREVRERGYGEDEEYLRYFILASEVAICS